MYALGGALAAAVTMALFLAVPRDARAPAGSEGTPVTATLGPRYDLPAPATTAHRDVPSSGRTMAMLGGLSHALDAGPLRGELAALLADGVRGTRAVLDVGGLAGLLDGPRR